MSWLQKFLSIIFSVDMYRKLFGQLIFKHVQIKKEEKAKKAFIGWKRKKEKNVHLEIKWNTF